MDVKDVIDHLQIMHTWASFALENDINFFNEKHFQKIVEWTDGDITLLKNQEAVKPRSKSRHGANPQIQHFCGNCNAMLHGKPKYCSSCGREQKWK